MATIQDFTNDFGLGRMRILSRGLPDDDDAVDKYHKAVKPTLLVEDVTNLR